MNRHTHSSLAAMLMLSTAMVSMAAFEPVFAMPDEGGGGGGPGVKLLSVRASLSALDAQSDADWTNAGLPDMKRLKAMTGNHELTREEVAKVLPGFNRTNADTAPTYRDPEGYTPEPHPDARPPKPSETGDAAVKAAAAAKAPGAELTAEEVAAASANTTKPAHEAEVLEGTGADKTTTTAADALRADRKGEEFGGVTDPAPKVETEDGRNAADLDVQEVGLQETAPLSDAEAQAQSAAALAGDQSDIPDYDRGFLRGFTLGKAESDKHAAQVAKPEEAEKDYLTRESRNAVTADDPTTAAPAAIDPTAVAAAAGNDAIALCEALMIAIASDKYRRNSALTSFARGYLVSQGEIKEVQRRLDIRADQRDTQREEDKKLTTLKA